MQRGDMDQYTKDRFMTADMMIAVSRELEEAGFTHVTSAHLIDPKWRSQYRPGRPELEPIAWTIRLSEGLIPMQFVKKLITICERHDLTFWMGDRGEFENPELYVKIARADSGARQRAI